MDLRCEEMKAEVDEEVKGVKQLKNWNGAYLKGEHL